MAYQNERSVLINNLQGYAIWSYEDLCNKQTSELEKIKTGIERVIDITVKTTMEIVEG